MNTYTLFWLTGETDIIKGDTISDAFRRSGYGGGSINALDFYEIGDKRDDYIWENKKWIRNEKKYGIFKG